MLKSIRVFLCIPILLTKVDSHVIWESSGELHPVHGLYVKPSINGTTGDLYVAATEENGVKSQWLTDQPVNFLAATPQTKAIPVSLTSSVTKTTSPQEETITSQKRAVITSPAVQYAFALPVAGIDESSSYPFAYPTSLPDGQSIPACSTDVPAQPYPFPYFYPYMMSVIANAMTALKEGELGDEKMKGSSLIGSPAPYWPHSYAYPYQYLMVDPSAWVHGQSNLPTLPTPTATSDEVA